MSKRNESPSWHIVVSENVKHMPVPCQPGERRRGLYEIAPMLCFDSQPHEKNDDYAALASNKRLFYYYD